VLHNTAQNSCDNLLCYPSDNHHSSDDVYWRGGEPNLEQLWTIRLGKQTETSSYNITENNMTNIYTVVCNTVVRAMMKVNGKHQTLGPNSSLTPPAIDLTVI